MLIVEYAGEGPTPFDGQYVVDYDPGRPSTAPDGTDLPFRLITTPDPAAARLFDSSREALEFWNQQHGIRSWDGGVNRPLTAWSVQIEEAYA